MCKWGTEDVLVLPEHICVQRENRTVAVDRCIAGQIRALWTADIQTLGCCCGHGKEPPSIVIESGYTDDEVGDIEKLLAAADSRQWEIMQWRLQTVGQHSRCPKVYCPLDPGHKEPCMYAREIEV